MIRVAFLLCLGLVLSGCVGATGLFGRAALGAVGRASVGEATVASARLVGGRAAASSSVLAAEGAVARAQARLLIEPRAAQALEGRAGAFAQRIASGEVRVTLGNDGVISAGGQRFGAIQGSSLYLDDGLSGAISGGRLYHSGQPVARIRALVPARGTPVVLDSGEGIMTVRPVAVDLLELSSGRYKVVLPGGATGYIDAGAVTAVSLVALTVTQDCRSENGQGMLIRKGGEPILFASCDRGDGVVILNADNRKVVVDDEDIREIVPADAAATA